MIYCLKLAAWQSRKMEDIISVPIIEYRVWEPARSAFHLLWYMPNWNSPFLQWFHLLPTLHLCLCHANVLVSGPGDAVGSRSGLFRTAAARNLTLDPALGEVWDLKSKKMTCWRAPNVSLIFSNTFLSSCFSLTLEIHLHSSIQEAFSLLCALAFKPPRLGIELWHLTVWC